MTNSRNAEDRRCLRGFTIVELMLVVALIALLLGASVPLIFKIDELSRDRSGVNTFGVAVTAARAYATRKIADNDELNKDTADGYSGAAIIVIKLTKPDRLELRLAQDVQDAGAEGNGQNAFRDILRTESIAMPRGTGVVGIGRDAAGLTGFKLVEPIFAIRFDQRGHLVSSLDPSSRFAAKYNGTEIATVGGVIVYSEADFEDAGGVLEANTAPLIGCDDGDCGTIAEWMFDNGSVLFFNRYSGALIRNNLP